eukprot:344214_1
MRLKRTKSTATLWLWLLLIFGMSIVVKLGSDSPVSACQYVVTFNFCVSINSGDMGFLNSNWKLLQTFMRSHYALEYLRAKKSYRVCKRQCLKNLEYEQTLRSMLLWKLVLLGVCSEIRALIVKTIVLVISAIAISILLLSITMISFEKRICCDYKLVTERSSLCQSILLCTGLLLFNSLLLHLVFPSGLNFISALIYVSWFISSKKRNKLVYAVNGNPTLDLPKTVSTTGNEQTARANPSTNSESFAKTISNTSNLSNSILKSNPINSLTINISNAKL